MDDITDTTGTEGTDHGDLAEAAASGAYDIHFGQYTEATSAIIDGYTTGAEDTDHDGIGDTIYKDMDGDGIKETSFTNSTPGGLFADVIRVDQDGDGIPDVEIDKPSYGDENPEHWAMKLDTDHDGVMETTITDTDGDYDADQVTSPEGTISDTDSNQTWDTLVTDADGDGTPETTQLAPVSMDSPDPTAHEPSGVLGPEVDNLLTDPTPNDPASPTTSPEATDEWAAQQEQKADEWEDWLHDEQQERYIDSFTNPYQTD